ncbi:MAG: FHA domain-containing protein [Anaerolineae bacterium]|nr:FHA domain-containing protein [Anaerolineae bacterium]MBN8619484.1 FHA domain-containing protein [Anaerolineae bacterium]
MARDISITYMSGPLDGKTLSFQQPDLGDERILSIGRREGCDVHLHFDSQASRVHAHLGILSIPVTASESVENPYMLGFWLEDQRSRNGTFVEKDKNPVKGRVSLRPGTLFRVGRTWLRLDVPLTYDADSDSQL